MVSEFEVQYAALVGRVLEYGIQKESTKGPSHHIFGYQLELKPDEVPLIQGRKMHPKGIVGELKAFLNNENTVEGFEKHGCNFWGAWSNEDGSLDVDYARLLHDFNGISQLDRLIKGLKSNPGSRKHVISLWDPNSGALQVPCVVSYQWNVADGKLNMIWTQRSADIMIGLASDMLSAWLFNHLIAEAVGLKHGSVYMHLGDAHIYTKHKQGAETYLNDRVPLLLNRNLEATRYLLDFRSLQDFDFNLYYESLDPLEFELCV